MKNMETVVLLYILERKTFFPVCKPVDSSHYFIVIFSIIIDIIIAPLFFFHCQYLFELLLVFRISSPAFSFVKPYQEPFQK